MITEALQGIIDTFAGFLAMITSILPASPFKALSELSLNSELLSTLAWVVPFPQIIALLEAWGAAILLYYVYMVILRWVKVLQ